MASKNPATVFIVISSFAKRCFMRSTAPLPFYLNLLARNSSAPSESTASVAGSGTITKARSMDRPWYS